MRRTSAHRNTRLRPGAPIRRVLAVAMAFLMLMASLPMDAVASLLDRATVRRVISETMPDGSVFSSEYDAFGRMLGGNPGGIKDQILTDILYSGEQFAPGLRMEYLRVRYYDQDSGRFNRHAPFDGNYERNLRASTSTHMPQRPRERNRFQRRNGVASR